MLENLIRIIIPFLIFNLALCEGDKPEGFPSPLTEKNFKQTLSSGLCLIEFYSPYCSHCNSFAPIWEKTWQIFHKEKNRFGIDMFQVNCVESGNLCNEERISVYPSLKLYGPDGFIKNYPNTYHRNEEHLLKFMKNQAIKLSDPNLNVESLSKLISTNDMINYLVNPIEQPILISFWPSYELEDLNIIDAKKFFTENDDDAISFQRTWKIVSNQIDESIKVGHFNCLANKKICSELGLNLKSPGVALFLPNLPTGKVIVYDQTIYSLIVNEIVSFASRVTKIAEFKEITELEFSENYGITSSFNYLSALPETSETYFIYLYDPETASKEDFDILPYLTDPLSKLPNTHFFKSNDSTMLALAKTQKQAIPKAVNAKLNLETIPDIDETRLLFELSTTQPTILCFKEHSILPEVYHSNGPTDIRDQYRIIEWIKKNSKPFIDEYNLSKLRKYFAEPSGKLALVLLENKENSPDNLKNLNSFMVSNLNYHDFVNNHIFNRVFKDRKIKGAKYEQMESQGKDTKALLKQLSKEVIPLEFDQVHIGFFDLSGDSTLSEIGVSTYGKNYSNGDVIIFDGAKFYYDIDEENQATIKPERLAASLLMAQGIVQNKNKAKLRDSSFPSILKLLDDIHQHGLINYPIILIALFAIYKKGIKILNMLVRKPLKKNTIGSHEKAGKLV